MLLIIAIGAVAAWITGMVLTALARRMAGRLGLVDQPDGHRKLQKVAIPLGGGAAVFVSTTLVLATLAIVPNPLGSLLQKNWAEMAALFAACGATVGLGLLDDRFGLRGRHKLLGQIAAASILLFGGLVIRQIDILELHFELGILAIPFTLFWLVGAMNSVNLLDGIDGLAGTLGFILSATIGLMGLITGHLAVALVAFVFAGSLLGFLRFNYPPASIYLGDTGSMLIGLLVGALAIKASLKGPGTVLLAAPLAVWTLPLFDSAAAILRRKLTGRSIYTTDRGHLHHCLLDALGSNKRVLAVVAVCCAATSAGALATAFFKNDAVALISCAAVVLILVVSGVFGRAETLLLVNRLWTAGLGTARPGARVQAVRLQGSGQWDVLWEKLVESAEPLKLNRIRLDLNLPAAREGYNAVWEQPYDAAAEHCWRVELPLFVNSQIAGTLEIVGRRNGEPVREHIEQILKMLEPFETQLVGFASERPALAHP